MKASLPPSAGAAGAPPVALWSRACQGAGLPPLDPRWTHLTREASTGALASAGRRQGRQCLGAETAVPGEPQADNAARQPHTTSGWIPAEARAATSMAPASQKAGPAGGTRPGEPRGALHDQTGRLRRDIASSRDQRVPFGHSTLGQSLR